MVREFEYALDYDDPLIALLYDRSETYTDDVALIRKLLAGELVGGAASTGARPVAPLNILECFSGTGRILTPLAIDGHRVTGLEIAPAMAARAQSKLSQLPKVVRDRVIIKVQDVIGTDWGHGYDLVILGANCFYELPSATMQEECIRRAWDALCSGGRVFIDNDDDKGDWGRGPFGREQVIFEGSGEDGAFARLTLTAEHFDEGEHVLHMRRTMSTRRPDGTEARTEYRCRKHPVGAAQVEAWLRRQGFAIAALYGDRRGDPYTGERARAIFWARKP